MEQRITRLEEEITDIKTRLAVAESNIKDIKEDISSIKNNTAWILRMIVGLIITFVFKFFSESGL